MTECKATFGPAGALSLSVIRSTANPITETKGVLSGGKCWMEKIALNAGLEALVILACLASPTKPDKCWHSLLPHVALTAAILYCSKHRFVSVNLLFSGLHKHLDGVGCRVGRDNKCKLLWLLISVHFLPVARHSADSTFPIACAAYFPDRLLFCFP